ncbi:MAG: dUTP diphosphatase [Hyphomicrobium sp.]|nr:dUTP diphosphatase [Hyphomicrobium sp.]MBY0559923.1 dUTP diphosphatase [Hyphomicrobium sp.]
MQTPAALARLGPVVSFKRLPNGHDLPLPAKAHPGDAGLDLRAACEADMLIFPKGGRVLVPIGFSMKLPPGHEAQIRPRSGLALKHGISVLNSPGTIDEGFTGAVGVILINHGADPFPVKRGDRIAQLVIQRIPEIEVVEAVDDFEATERGAGGFGSTGLGT